MGWPTGTLAKASQALRKLSMLDVLIAGVFVVTLCMSMYRKNGIFVSMRYGVPALLVAEILHYATYYFVMSASKQPAAGPAYEDLVTSEGALFDAKAGLDGV